MKVIKTNQIKKKKEEEKEEKNKKRRRGYADVQQFMQRGDGETGGTEQDRHHQMQQDKNNEV